MKYWETADRCPSDQARRKDVKTKKNININMLDSYCSNIPVQSYLFSNSKIPILVKHAIVNKDK